MLPSDHCCKITLNSDEKFKRRRHLKFTLPHKPCPLGDMFLTDQIYNFWFKLYFICIIYDKYTNNTEYDYNTTTIQMGFRRKSNDLFESVYQEFTLLIYILSCRNCHYVENNGRTL